DQAQRYPPASKSHTKVRPSCARERFPTGGSNRRGSATASWRQAPRGNFRYRKQVLPIGWLPPKCTGYPSEFHVSDRAFRTDRGTALGGTRESPLERSHCCEPSGAHARRPDPYRERPCLYKGRHSALYVSASGTA